MAEQILNIAVFYMHKYVACSYTFQNDGVMQTPFSCIVCIYI